MRFASCNESVMSPPSLTFLATGRDSLPGRLRYQCETEARRSSATAPNEEANFGVNRRRLELILRLSQKPYLLSPDEFMASD